MMNNNKSKCNYCFQRIYAERIKRVLDFILSISAIAFLFPLLVFLAIVGALAMKGNPFFVQPRPGKNERIFKLVKFRTMNNKKDSSGNLLPDEQRLTKYGKFLRKSSLDELPELWNIAIGDMSIIGPRPQLVRDMVFMTPKQRQRHMVRPGLSGLAQVHGRNDIDWEEKLSWDLKYIQNITFWGDVKIIILTLWKAFVKQEGITEGDMATAEDFGDYLLGKGKITRDEYNKRQREARRLLIQGHEI